MSLLLGIVSLGRVRDQEGRVGCGQSRELQQSCPCAYRPGTSPVGEPGVQGPLHSSSRPSTPASKALLASVPLHLCPYCALHLEIFALSSTPPALCLPASPHSSRVTPLNSCHDTDELSCFICSSTSTLKGLWESSCPTHWLLTSISRLQGVFSSLYGPHPGPGSGFWFTHISALINT